MWFVAKHNNVSACAKLIDNACSRTFKNTTSALYLEAGADQLMLSEDTVLLDPNRNVPMKIYSAQQAELPLLAQTGWKAPLRLNQREQSVRAQAGTVLLLGRSGTGKTLCVMDRMKHDRQQCSASRHASADPTRFRQLFVTRSGTLCDFVRMYQQHNYSAEDLANTAYLTFDLFLENMEGKDGASTSNNKMVDFRRFRDKVVPLLKVKSSASSLDPQVVWTQIRFFIKGSIEGRWKAESYPRQRI